MPTTINGTTGVSQVQDGTITSAKIVDGAVTPADTQQGALPSLVRCKTHNGYGSTNTRIPRFTTTITNQGSDITYTDSATLGASFTINTTGVYAINFNMSCGTGSFWACLTLNETSFTLPANSVPDTEYLGIASNGIYSPSNVSCTLYLPAGSVIRPHGDGNTYGAFMFTIQRVA